MRIECLGLVCLSLFRASPAIATTWYVSSINGDDRNSGISLASAFLTPQHAANLTVPGDVVKFIGTFTGSIGVPPLLITRSGMPGRSITFESYYQSGTGPRAVFHGTGAQGVIVGEYPISYITINNLETVGTMASLTWAGASENFGAAGDAWQSTTYNENGIFFGGGVGGQTVHHLTITNCLVHDVPGGGIALNFSDYVTVTGNVVYNTSNYSPWQTSGISLYALHSIDGSTTTKNLVSENMVYSVMNLIPNRVANISTVEVAAPSAPGVTTIATSSVAEANYTMRVIDSTNGAISPGSYIHYFDGNVIHLAGGITTGSGLAVGDILKLQYVTDGEGVIIDNNTNSQTDGIPYVGRTLVRNNVIFNNGGSCISAAPGTNNVDVIFNTCFENQVSFQNNSGANGEFNGEGSSGTNVYNNIFVALSTAPSSRDHSNGRTAFVNNLFFGGNGTHRISLGATNFLADPWFVNPSSDRKVANFQLRPGSAGIDAGSDKFSRESDYLGNPGLNGPAYDVGAYESVCSGKVAAFTFPCSN